MFRSKFSFLFALSVSFTGLMFGWVSAARADESVKPQHVEFELDTIRAKPPVVQPKCFRKLLANGRIGETVLVCGTEQGSK